jgi:DNA-binding NarL/FixJ family response regulator
MNENSRVAQGLPAASSAIGAGGETSPGQTAVWLASNSESFRSALLSALASHPQVLLLGHCGADDPSLALRLAERRPDLLLIDWLGTTRAGRVPYVMKYYAALAPHVLLLVHAPTAGIVEGILKHRLHGYLRFASNGAECLRAIERVRQGEVWIPRARLAAAVAELLWQRDANGGNAERIGNDTTLKFTTREHQIVFLVRQGLTNKQIGRELGIVEDTVKKHLQHIYDKIGVRRRALLALNGASASTPLSA